MGTSISATESTLRSGSVGGAFSCSSPLGYSGGVARGGRLIVTVANGPRSLPEWRAGRLIAPRRRRRHDGAPPPDNDHRQHGHEPEHHDATETPDDIRRKILAGRCIGI